MKRFLSILLVILVGCLSEPAITPHPVSGTVTRYTLDKESDMQWRLELFSPSGDFKRYVELDDPVESLDSFTVGGDGDSKEATFKALASALGVEARDIVRLLARSAETSWIPRFTGTATKPGAKRSPNTSDFKLVGLKKRFSETVIHAKRSSGGDVAAVVRRLVQDNLPGGVGYTGATVRDLDVQVGERLHNLETLAEALDALAALCPGFTVLPGSSYSYLNRTYGPGEYVPPVTWGVDWRGVFFFRRATGTLTLDEGVTGTVIEWHEPDAEEVISAVTVNVFSKPQPNALKLDVYSTNSVNPGRRSASDAFKPHPVNVTYRAPEDAGLSAEKVVLRADGVDYFKPISELGHDDANVGGNAQNKANAYDGDPESYASNSGSSVRMVQASSSPIYKVRLTYELRSGALTLRVRHTQRLDSLVSRHAEGTLELEVTGDAGKRTVEVYMSEEASLDAESFRVEATGRNLAQSGDWRAYSLEVFTLNEALTGEYAKSFIKLPAEDPATVSVYGEILSSAPEADLTLLTGETIRRRVATLEYSLTHEAGALTQVRLEQPSSADLLAQATLIRNRDEASVLKAVRFN